MNLHEEVVSLARTEGLLKCGRDSSLGSDLAFAERHARSETEKLARWMWENYKIDRDKAKETPA